MSISSHTSPNYYEARGLDQDSGLRPIDLKLVAGIEQELVHHDSAGSEVLDADDEEYDMRSCDSNAHSPAAGQDPLRADETDEIQRPANQEVVSPGIEIGAQDGAGEAFSPATPSQPAEFEDACDPLTESLPNTPTPIRPVEAQSVMLEQPAEDQLDTSEPLINTSCASRNLARGSETKCKHDDKPHGRFKGLSSAVEGLSSAVDLLPDLKDLVQKISPSDSPSAIPAPQLDGEPLMDCSSVTRTFARGPEPLRSQLPDRPGAGSGRSADILENIALPPHMSWKKLSRLSLVNLGN